MRGIIRALYGTFRGIVWVGSAILEGLRWIKVHWILLGIVALLLIAGATSVILPMRFPHVPFTLIYLGILAFAVLSLAIIFAVAMDRMAETIGVAIKQEAMLRQTNSALHQAMLKNNALMEQQIHLQNALIGKLNETDQLITIASKEVASATGDFIRSIQSH